MRSRYFEDAQNPRQGKRWHYGGTPVTPGHEDASSSLRENQTYGDMIVLDHLHEDDVTANMVKTL